MKLHPLPAATRARRRAGASGLDLLLLAGGAALFIWGGLYVGSYSGRFDPNEFSEIAHGPAPKVAAVAADPNAKVLQLGQRVYANCAACHQADGAGDASKAVPPLAGSDWVLADGPNRIIRVVLGGLKGKLVVKGQDYGTAEMLAWLKSADNPAGLTPEEIAAVLSYVRNSWGNKAGIVSPDQVKAVVDTVTKENHSGAWTPDELLKLPVAVGGGGASGPLTADQLKAALKALPADQLQAVLKDIKP